MKAFLFLALFCLFGLASSTIYVNGTNETYYLTSLECIQDETSGNIFCLEPSTQETILNSTADTYTAIDGATARFGGYPEETTTIACGGTYASTERAISITSTPLKYDRVDTINPAGSIFYSELNLTVQSNPCTACPTCNTTETITQGLSNYTGSVKCGETFFNEDYNITINTTPAGSGTVYLYPNESRLFPTCGLTVLCQASQTTCPTCPPCDLTTLQTQLGCTGTKQLALGENVDACGITVFAPPIPTLEIRNITSGQTITNLERGYQITCDEYDCYTDAMERLNLTTTNCTTTIVKEDGTEICLDNWKQNCKTDQILAGEEGLNSCFSEKVMGFKLQYDDCVVLMNGEKTRADNCELATEKSSIWAYVFFAVVAIVVGGYSSAKILKNVKERKKKIPNENRERV